MCLLFGGFTVLLVDDIVLLPHIIILLVEDSNVLLANEPVDFTIDLECGESELVLVRIDLKVLDA